MSSSNAPWLFLVVLLGCAAPDEPPAPRRAPPVAAVVPFDQDHVQRTTRALLEELTARYSAIGQPAPPVRLQTFRNWRTDQEVDMEQVQVQVGEVLRAAGIHVTFGPPTPEELEDPELRESLLVSGTLSQETDRYRISLRANSLKGQGVVASAKVDVR